MSNPNLRSHKLVLPAVLYHKYRKLPIRWKNALGDCNYSALVSGRTGSGKDSLTLAIMDRDIEYGRTVVVLDKKMEYVSSIFCQNDVILRNILLRHGCVGRGYKVNLWIPYIEGLEKNNHFKMLLKCHHPNLQIRPYRILIENFVSEDSYNMALAKTQLQSMVKDRTLLKGQSGQLNELKEQMARERLGFDDSDRWEEGCGWEYIDFEELTSNKQVNVITPFFMGKNSIAATSYMVGLTNEFLAIAMSINNVRNPNEIFTVIIPEVEILLPKGVKSLDDIVNTLRFSIRIGLKLLRSFGMRFRMNLQNLSSLDPDILSQSILYAGKTWNPKDLNILSIFGISREKRTQISRSRTGQFHDVIHKSIVDIVPFSHKAREREYFVLMMKQYYRDPSAYLFETPNYFLSEIVDIHHVFYDGKALTVPEYNRRVRKWLKKQSKREMPCIPELPILDKESAAKFEAEVNELSGGIIA